VAGLCRVLARREIKVAPFKPQNIVSWLLQKFSSFLFAAMLILRWDFWGKTSRQIGLNMTGSRFLMISKIIKKELKFQLLCPCISV
jgi:hypothetical protein